MDNNFNSNFSDTIKVNKEKPMLLKVLCILTFILASLIILGFGIAAIVCLAMSPEKIEEVWEKVLESQPMLDGTDPILFFSEVGKICLYYALFNIVSLVGAIMMWRINKAGLVLYAIAEIAVNFIGFGLTIAGQSTGFSMGTVLYIVIDVIFIVLYFVALKQATKTQLTN